MSNTSPEQGNAEQQSGQSSTDYAGMLEDSRIQDPKEAEYVAHKVDRSEELIIQDRQKAAQLRAEADETSPYKGSFLQRLKKNLAWDRDIKEAEGVANRRQARAIEAELPEKRAIADRLAESASADYRAAGGDPVERHIRAHSE